MRFFRRKDLVAERQGRLGQKDKFLQPLAVGIVSAILVTLILIMGLLDIRRSEANLVGFLEDQALGTISVLQKLTEENLRSIVSPAEKSPSGSAPVTREEAAYSKRWVIEAITELGRRVDEQWRKDKVDDAYLKHFAAENNLWYVAVLDRYGNIVYQSSPLRTDLLDRRELFWEGRRLSTLEILEKIRAKYGIGFVALRRKDGSGMVVINLDKEGLIYWSLKVAVEKGMRQIGEGHGIFYVQIIDDQKKLLSSVGRPTHDLKSTDFNYKDILAGKIKIASRKVDAGGRKVLDLAAPLFLDKSVVGIVRMGLDRGSMDKIIAESKQNIFIFMIFIAIIALLSMWLLYYDQNRHFSGIIEMERRLEKAERLSSLGQLAAGVAHEIRNPLNAISMAAQRLKRDFEPSAPDKTDDFHNLSGVIKDEIKRLNGIIEEFLSFSKSRRLELRDFSVTEILQKIVSLISEEAQARGITIETKWQQSPAVIPVDINKIQQAFLNLIKNAMESIPAQGKIFITVDKEGKNFIVVRISDTGCGMAAEEIERIFNPEYTTKEKGVGLGIPLASEIIRGHGGDIRVISRKGEGTTFEVLLPRERLNDRTLKDKG
ncbi:MAG TPA: ATP-binding protein [Smithellaceae bacterium]|nr:ATP-binding protein [Smithellaceae bacterium]HRS88180.1 ATP-binding protein [Smithellaceae bacterium]HRV25712.1 ATP-binding protein [Smithellaceae bacterium]